MFNKQYAKAFLKENKQTQDEKDSWVSAIIGEELTKHIENLFTTYRDIQQVGQAPGVFVPWVKDKFKELTNKNPEDYSFTIRAVPDFQRFGCLSFAVRFAMKPTSGWGTNIIADSMPITATDIYYTNNTERLGVNNINYAEQLPPADIVYNGNVYTGATVTSMDAYYPTETFATRLIDGLRMTERYGIGIINARSIASTTINASMINAGDN